MRRLLLVFGLVLAGCTGTESGTPTAGHTTSEEATTTAESTTAESTTDETTTDETPARPRDIDMAGLDVCGLVTALPLATFGLDKGRTPVGGDSTSFPGAQDCFANGVAANLGLTLVAVTDEGAADYAEFANAEVSETEVAGFPLYVLKPSAPDSCFGALDVADGQLLYINYGLSAPGTKPVTPQETLCERVPLIAAEALAKL